MCSFPWLVRLRNEEMGVRCPRCAASAVTLSLADILRRIVPDLEHTDVYELSSQGPLVDILRRRARSLATSEFFDHVEPGTLVDGVQCQDVQRLTFADHSFDLCTSTEVFEHVEDDRVGFSEIRRVLRPGGRFVFTVPLSGTTTQERTALVEGRRVPTLPPAYHADRYRGAHVLVFRDYGADIVERLRSAGFASAGLHAPAGHLFGHARPVVVACR